MAQKSDKHNSDLETKHILWEHGVLHWKLQGQQKEIYDYINNPTEEIACVLISRRFGKSFTCCLYAVEYCLQNPNSIVKYACPQQKMVKTIIKPIMRKIFEDAPAELMIDFNTQDNVFRFSNGSEIQIAGTDNGNAENLRGSEAHLIIADEAGFMDDLDYVINSIMLPMFDTTDGKLILASTPNYKDPNHPFHELFIKPLEAQGKLLKKTFYDSPFLNETKRNKIINRYEGGLSNSKFRCEYLVEIPRTSEDTILPEFTDELEKELIFNPDSIIKPPYRDYYVSMDIGFRDLTIVLFAYYNFMEATLYITDELVMHGQLLTTENLAKSIEQKESENFLDIMSGLPDEPFIRIMDLDLKLQNDLRVLHNMHFTCTEKDNLEAAINKTRIWLANRRIKISSKCKTLLYHIKHGQWDKSRKKFKRLKNSPDEGLLGGHVDGIAALIYLIRNINESNNPFPTNYGMPTGENIFYSPKRVQEYNNGWDGLAKALSVFTKKR